MGQRAQERRQHTRFALRLPLRLRRTGDAQTVETFTENLSTHGFYCYCPWPESFRPSDELECVLQFADFQRLGLSVDWRCRARVLRVDPMANGAGIGLGCSILSYSVHLR